MQPLGPVAAEVEEVLEVHEPHSFELFDERRQLLIAVNRTDRDQASLDAELVRREVQAFVDRLTREPGAREGTLPNDDRRNGKWNGQWHA